MTGLFRYFTRSEDFRRLPKRFTTNFAHTSPIYVAVGDDWSLFDHAAAKYMLTLVDGGLAHIRHQARYYPKGSVTHHHGEEDHQAYLERPFHEAISALHARMHQLGIAH